MCIVLIMKNQFKKLGTFHKREPFSHVVLKFLMEKSEHVLDLTGRLIVDPHSLAGISIYGNHHYYLPREISNLKKSPYFEFKHEKFYLTQKGRLKIIKRVIQTKRNQIGNWDGIWRGIIFDIPEASRKDRNFLRRELRDIGCKEIQKSIWVTPLDIEKELLAILKLWKKDFTGDIRFLKITHISDQDDIKAHFEL